MLLEVKNQFYDAGKVGADKGCTKDCQQILFILVHQNRRLDKGRFAQLDIGQGSSAVPCCTLSLQRKMIATSAKSIYEKAEHIVTSDSGGRIASHRGGTIPANVG